jgi:DNA polymerase-4
MAPLPVRLIPGVGPALGETLARMGVRTAGELAAIPPPLLEGVAGSWAGELHLKARGAWRGDPVGDDDGGPRLPGSVGHETTFEEDTTDPAFLEATLFTLAERAAVRLRARGLEARRVTVKVRYGDFVTSTRAASVEASALERDLFRAALPSLRALLERRMRVRLVGISCSALRPAGLQEDLFRRGDARRREACRSLDRLKTRFGFDAVRWATGINRDGHQLP